jgi:hypothetical protein
LDLLGACSYGAIKSQWQNVPTSFTLQQWYDYWFWQKDFIDLMIKSSVRAYGHLLGKWMVDLIFDQKEKKYYDLTKNYFITTSLRM